MAWLVDPKSREPLPALPSDGVLRYGPAGHPANGWITERKNGIPVRMRWCECHCPIHQAEIDAVSASIRAGVR